MAFWNRRRSIDAMLAPHDGPALKKTLGWPHLMALGVGAIVGTGILTLIGVGAGLAGPAVMISFALAGLVCACAALAYAELSTMMPQAGSAYTYSYAVLGELIAAYMAACDAAYAGDANLIEAEAECFAAAAEEIAERFRLSGEKDE